MIRNRVRFTATYDVAILEEITDGRVPTLLDVATAILYNIIACYTDPHVNDGWARLSLPRWERTTGLNKLQMRIAIDKLIEMGYIEHNFGVLNEQDAKYGPGNLYRIRRPTFGAINEAKGK